MPAFINQLILPSTSSLFDQQELNVSKNLETHNSITSIDREDLWNPASSSSDSDEDKSVQTVEEETSVVCNHVKENNPESSVLSKRVFRNIFKRDFNIGLHLPKKDKCGFCEKCKNLPPEN
ncbi:unnamed protein product [Parnassius apollo]|uniref:(apollo) hypothetical protein n=1 Tax=Parnassius apollo TaxID=110799 RepID=A0A8S3W6N0_PARAO|nr:unnamed protein product [Parnassius apollo]